MFPPNLEPQESVETSKPIEKSPSETIEVCELALVSFFAGRGLISQKAVDEEQRKTHDEKYNKERRYDDDDVKKGKIMLKKFRKEDINAQSNCDSQYVNNLHTYYGDGSKLKPLPRQQHYAMDFVNPHSNETADQTTLKNLEVIRAKKSVAVWVDKHKELGLMNSLRSRSYSCHEFEFEIPPQTNVEYPKSRTKFDKLATIYNHDIEFRESVSSARIFEYDLNSTLCSTVSALISKVNAFDHTTGRLDIAKVLFSTDKLYAYVIPKRFDTSILLKQFSKLFQEWVGRLPPHARATFGTGKEDKFKDKFRKIGMTPSNAYFSRVNVILCLQEFEKEGTMFRRARHVCPIPHYNPKRDIYFEMDTGMLRVVETKEATVRRMPQEFAHVPTPILEVRFEGVTTKEEVALRIEEIRRTGFIYIRSFDTGNRGQVQKDHYKGMNSKKWSDLETAVAVPLKTYPHPLITTLFCGETYCMGLCCTEKYLEKSEVSPSTVSIPSAWVADKRETKRHFVEKEPTKFKFVPSANSHTTSTSFQPKPNSSNQPSTSNYKPFISSLEKEDVSDFFK